MHSEPETNQEIASPYNQQAEFFQNNFPKILQNYQSLPASTLQTLFARNLTLLKPPIRKELTKSCSDADIIKKVCTQLLPEMSFPHFLLI